MGTTRAPSATLRASPFYALFSKRSIVQGGKTTKHNPRATNTPLLGGRGKLNMNSQHTLASFAPLPPAAIYRPPSAVLLNWAVYNNVGCTPCAQKKETRETQFRDLGFFNYCDSEEVESSPPAALKLRGVSHNAQLHKTLLRKHVTHQRVIACIDSAMAVTRQWPRANLVRYK